MRDTGVYNPKPSRVPSPEPPPTNGHAPNFGNGRRPTGGGWFKISNALIDQRWLPRLKPNELKVLLAFQRFTFAADGITLVGPEKIAALTGISVSNVRAATARLRRFGILITIDPGGGRNRACKRTVQFPETLPKSGRESTPAKPSRNLDANPPEFCAETLPKSGPKPSLNSGASLDFSSKTSSKDNSKRRVAAAEPVEGDGEKNGEAIRDLLRQAGIGNPKRDELAALSHLTVERIAAVIAEAEGRPEQKRPGYIIRRLEGTQDRIESPIEKILTTLDCEPQPHQPIKPPPCDPAIAILKAEGERWARANALIDKMKVEQPEKFSRTVAEAFAKLIPVLQAKYRPDPFQSKQFRAELFAIVERETHCGVGLPAPAKQLEVACG
jgi:hypothetical protein